MADVFTAVGETVYVDTLIANQTYRVGWGTGTTAASKSDTALVAESGEARATPTATNNGDNFDLVASITSSSTQTITEMGVFDADTGGNLIIRSVFAGISLNNGDKIEFTINQVLS